MDNHAHIPGAVSIITLLTAEPRSNLTDMHPCAVLDFVNCVYLSPPPKKNHGSTHTRVYEI